MTQLITRFRFTSIFLLILLTLLFFHRLAFTDMILARGDTFNYFYPYWDIRNASFRAGELPLWSPDIFAGVPLLANPQLGTYYPPNWLTIPFQAPDAIRLSILIHVAWAAIGTYVLSRRTLQLSQIPALTSAIVLALGGYLGAHVEQINQLQGLAWIPWLFWLWHNTLNDENTTRYLLLTGIGIALQLFTGHTQTVFITGTGLGIYMLGYIWLQPKRNWQEIISPIIFLFGVVVIAILLALPQILPTLELIGMSNRSGGFNIQQVTAFSLPPEYIGRSLLPSYDGQLFGEFVAYSGIIGLSFALVGILNRNPGNDYRKVWVVIALVGLLFALGRYTPVYLLVGQLPGFNLFRVPARWLALFALSTSLLAGMGLQSIMPNRQLPRRNILFTISIIIVLIFLTRLVFEIQAEDIVGSAIPTNETLLFWLLGVAGFVALVLLRTRISSSIIQIIALALIALELFLSSQVLPYNDLAPPTVYNDQRFTASQMLAIGENDTPPGRILSISNLLFDPGDNQRSNDRWQGMGIDEQAIRHAFVATKRQEVLFPNLPLTWGIPSIDGFGGGILPTTYYSQFTSLMLPEDELRSIDGRIGEILAKPECRGACIPDLRWLELADVEYLITDKVFDLWHEDVAYDTQLPVSISNDQTITYPVYTEGGFQATQVDVLYVGGEDFTLSNLQPALVATIEKEPLNDLSFSRFQLGQTTNISQIVIQATDETTIYAVTLVDEDAGVFLQLTPTPWQKILSSDIKLYQNLQHPGRAYVAYDIQASPDTWSGGENALVEMQNLPNPRHTAIIHGDIASIEADLPPTPTAITNYADTKIELEIEAEASGYVILLDAYYPGWKARVNGIPTEIFRANVMFRAIPISAGVNQIEIFFEPDLWFIAGLLGVFSWGGLVLGWIVIAYRKQRATPR